MIAKEKTITPIAEKKIIELFGLYAPVEISLKPTK